MRILVQTRKRTWSFTVERTEPDEPDDHQPRGDVYSTTERADDDGMPEMHVGFRGHHGP